MKLSKALREAQPLTIFVIITAVFVLAVILVAIPLYGKWTEVKKRGIEENKRLKSVISMGQEYISVKNEIEDIMDKAFKGDGTTLAGIDAVVTTAGLKKKLSSMKPTTIPVTNRVDRVKVELLMEQIPLADVVSLLKTVEADGHAVNIEKLSLKATYENYALFNVAITINYLEGK